MKKAKRSEVPPEYRDNKIQKLLDCALAAAITLGTVTIIMFLLILG